MKNMVIRRSFIIFIAAIMMFLLSGCNTSTIKQNDNYVASVKTLVNDVVNLNRTLKEQDESFNCHDEEKSKQYIATMDSLSDKFQQLLKLQATNEFDEYDKSLKNHTKGCLQHITQMKSLVSYAVQEGNDTFYQNDKQAVFDSYNPLCESMRNISSEIQTYWRNA